MAMTDASRQAERDEAWGGFISGLSPLAVLLATLLATGVAVLVVRAMVAGSGFFAQQQVTLVVLLAGILVAALLCVLSSRRVLRRVARWQERGLRGRATGALWALCVTALVIASPLVVAALLPQHPAP